MFLHLPVTLLTGEGGVSQHAMGQTPSPRKKPGRHPQSNACWEIRATTGNVYLCSSCFSFGGNHPQPSLGLQWVLRQPALYLDCQQKALPWAHKRNLW